MKKIFMIFIFLSTFMIISSVQAKMKIENRLPGGKWGPVSEINLIVNDVRELGDESRLKDLLVEFMIKNNIYLLYFSIRVPKTEILTANNAITYMDGYINEKYDMKTSLTGDGSNNLWYEFQPIAQNFREAYIKSHPPIYKTIRPQPYNNRIR